MEAFCSPQTCYQVVLGGDGIEINGIGVQLPGGRVNSVAAGKYPAPQESHGCLVSETVPFLYITSKHVPFAIRREHVG